MRVVVCYDIVDDQVRNKMADLLKDYGRRVQYSVFEVDVDQETLKALALRINRLIDTSTDRVRAYRICENCCSRMITMGRNDEASPEPFLIV